MSELVMRLRETYESVVTGNDVLRNPDGPEAAARIEQLEARLRFWCKAHEAQETELFIAAYESTRAALGEK